MSRAIVFGVGVFLGTLVGGGHVWALDQIGTNKAIKPNLSHTMNWDDCMKYSHEQTASEYVCKDGVKCIIPGKPPKVIYCTYVAPEYTIHYWEPSEIIEVSCRKGYSLVAPGRVGSGSSNTGESSPQSCFVPNGRGGKKWFFEARVWAVNGYLNGAREQSSQPSAIHKARQCTQDENDNNGKKYAGYGIKFEQFSRGTANGPGGSFEAYISDKDQSWQVDSGSAATSYSPQACSGKSVENCWGPMLHSGWVNHPNQALAAVTAAWRAHKIAVEKNAVSPPGKGGEVSGYKINMDYPFLYNTSPYAGSMGISGSRQSSGFMGSSCFQEGDAGPKWYTFQEKVLTPSEIPSFVNSLKDGNESQQAEIHTGVYIFTVWAYTACKRYGAEDRFNYHSWCLQAPTSCPLKKLPYGACYYKGDS